MRRMIQFKGNKIGVFIESVSGTSLSFMPIFSVTVTEDQISLDLSSVGKKYYVLPEGSSAREQVSYLLTCLTRAQLNEQTDMHKVVNAFIDHSLEKSTDQIIFTNNGYRVQEDLTEQYQKAPIY